MAGNRRVPIDNPVALDLVELLARIAVKRSLTDEDSEYEKTDSPSHEWKMRPGAPRLLEIEAIPVTRK